MSASLPGTLLLVTLLLAGCTEVADLTDVPSLEGVPSFVATYAEPTAGARLMLVLDGPVPILGPDGGPFLAYRLEVSTEGVTTSNVQYLDATLHVVRQDLDCPKCTTRRFTHLGGLPFGGLGYPALIKHQGALLDNGTRASIARPYVVENDGRAIVLHLGEPGATTAVVYRPPYWVPHQQGPFDLVDVKFGPPMQRADDAPTGLHGPTLQTSEGLVPDLGFKPFETGWDFRTFIGEARTQRTDIACLEGLMVSPPDHTASMLAPLVPDDVDQEASVLVITTEGQFQSLGVHAHRDSSGEETFSVSTVDTSPAPFDCALLDRSPGARMTFEAFARQAQTDKVLSGEVLFATLSRGPMDLGRPESRPPEQGWLRFGFLTVEPDYTPGTLGTANRVTFDPYLGWYQELTGANPAIQ